ncbi:21236_t:CDS:1, partial [Dentiscutata erythropus]
SYASAVPRRHRHKKHKNHKRNLNVCEMRRKNGQKAEDENEEFKSFDKNTKCTDNDVACIKGKIANCANRKFVITSCAPGTHCFSLPLKSNRGTFVTCDTKADAKSRIDTAKDIAKCEL